MLLTIFVHGLKNVPEKYYFCVMNDFPRVIHIDSSDNLGVFTENINRGSGMLLCQEGRVLYTDTVGPHKVMPGDMLIILPFNQLYINELSADFKGILCIVDMEFVFSAVKAISLGANLQFVTMHPLSHPTKEDIAVMLSIIAQIEDRSKYVEVRSLASMTIDSLWHALAYQILDSYLNVSQIETQGRGIKETIMHTFQVDLNRDFITHRNVSHYAALQNLSSRYFSTTIKEISGHSPLHWISLAVVVEAKRLMRDSNISIKEIGYALNFTSPTFFSRWFRHFAGETPTAYRTRSRITLSPEE